MDTGIFVARRARVLGEIAGGIMILPAVPTAIRNNDVEHSYRQDSDLFYLTGFDEEQSILVLSTLPEPKVTLFVRPRDKEREVWDGVRAGIEGAVQDHGADQAFPVSELEQRLPELISGHAKLYYHLGRYAEFDGIVVRALASARRRARKGPDYPLEVIDSDLVVHQHRRIKSPEEIELMRASIAITEEAHRLAMKSARPGMFEYELEAILRNTFRRRGSQRVAYEPIVGSGPNATVLHHVRNDRQIGPDELVLIDAGAEYRYYAADVTRTFPASGKFLGPQRALYELVLEAQVRAIEATRPGATLDGIHDVVVETLTSGLIELGFIEGPLATALEEKRYRPYYMHRTSHYLGMDVHDVGLYYRGGKPEPLEPGVVLTVEPGLYVSADDERAPEAFRGIGIRIEDDVLVTPGGAEVLSAAIPKSVADVEQACAR